MVKVPFVRWRCDPHCGQGHWSEVTMMICCPVVAIGKVNCTIWRNRNIIQTPTRALVDLVQASITNFVDLTDLASTVG